MILRVFKGISKPDANETAMTVLLEKATPLFRQAKGFKQLISAVDHATNKSVVITLWEAQEGIDALNANPQFQQIMAQASQYFSETLTLDGNYEVTGEI